MIVCSGERNMTPSWSIERSTANRWFKAGPPSATVAQRKTNNGWMFRVLWWSIESQLRMPYSKSTTQICPVYRPRKQETSNQDWSGAVPASQTLAKHQVNGYIVLWEGDVIGGYWIIVHYYMGCRYKHLAMALLCTATISDSHSMVYLPLIYHVYQVMKE